MEAEPVPQVRDISSTILSMVQGMNVYATTMSVALQVPAFTKALKVYTHTISAFPLKEYIGKDQVVARYFLTQPDPVTTYGSIMTRTVTDLLTRDVAYWHITARSWDGFPSAIEYMPYDQISFTPSADASMEVFPALGQIYWNGVYVPMRDIIRFDGDGLGGWLRTMASAVNTAAALEAACLRYAEYPSPNVILKNSGADLPASVVDDLLTAWEEARTSRSTAYLNSTISTESVGGFSPNDMQLTEARNASAIAIARQANLDAMWLNASTQGANLTYQNRVDMYRLLLDLSLTPVMRFISERLSMNDVTPRGHSVDFDTSVFLKANNSEITNLISTLRPLEVITVDEARDLLDLPDIITADPDMRP
jgi:hypothetical protein